MQSWDCTAPVHNLEIVRFLLHAQLNPGRHPIHIYVVLLTCIVCLPMMGSECVWALGECSNYQLEGLKIGHSQKEGAVWLKLLLKVRSFPFIRTHGSEIAIQEIPTLSAQGSYDNKPSTQQKGLGVAKHSSVWIYIRKTISQMKEKHQIWTTQWGGSTLSMEGHTHFVFCTSASKYT